MRCFLALAVLALAAAACGGRDGDHGPGTATVSVVGESGRAELTVELAVTSAERRQGLMGRGAVAEDAGMLFVFAQDTRTSFWMKDTTIPLSIAFIAADGSIIDIQDMEPLSEELHRSPEPYRYALEVNRGWFREHGFAAGDRVEGLESF